jgi:predicted ATPase
MTSNGVRGTGGVVLVDGAPGIGKSLLLRDATDEAAERGFSLVAAAADQLDQAIPFSALRAVLREPLTAGYLPDATAQIRAHLERRAADAPVQSAVDDQVAAGWCAPPPGQPKPSHLSNTVIVAATLAG